MISQYRGESGDKIIHDANDDVCRRALSPVHVLVSFSIFNRPPPSLHVGAEDVPNLGDENSPHAMRVIGSSFGRQALGLMAATGSGLLFGIRLPLSV